VKVEGSHILLCRLPDTRGIYYCFIIVRPKLFPVTESVVLQPDPRGSIMPQIEPVQQQPVSARCADLQWKQQTRLPSFAHHQGGPAMKKYIHQENLALFKKRLAEPRTNSERDVLKKLLADELAKEPPPKNGMLKPR
jgi:hypothetical protein